MAKKKAAVRKKADSLKSLRADFLAHQTAAQAVWENHGGRICKSETLAARLLRNAEVEEKFVHALAEKVDPGHELIRALELRLKELSGRVLKVDDATAILKLDFGKLCVANSQVLKESLAISNRMDELVETNSTAHGTIFTRLTELENSVFIFPVDAQERIPIAKKCLGELQNMRLEYDRAIMLLQREVEELKVGPLRRLWRKCKARFTHST